MICPLCKSSGETFYTHKEREFYICSNCKGIFLSQEQLPEKEAEKQRYQLHKNDMEDEGYQKFVSPITNSVLHDFEPKHRGLDFGAGTGPVITKILKGHNFKIDIYDPFFHPNAELLGRKYDYIVCCEVIEHFYNPYKEFKLLKSLLKPHAKLYLMTDIYDEKIDFAAWYYKNDPTHVFLYSKKTFDWIKNEFGFSDVFVEKRLIIFSV